MPKIIKFLKEAQHLTLDKVPTTMPNNHGKPLRTGALSPFKADRTEKISSSEKGDSKHLASSRVKDSNDSPLMLGFQLPFSVNSCYFVILRFLTICNKPVIFPTEREKGKWTLVNLFFLIRRHWLTMIVDHLISPSLKRLKLFTKHDILLD